MHASLELKIHVLVTRTLSLLPRYTESFRVSQQAQEYCNYIPSVQFLQKEVICVLKAINLYVIAIP